MSNVTSSQPLNLNITVLGRTLEHLGVQMYKRRDTAIAELVANSWDAGAKQVKIIVPEPEVYDQKTDSIVLEDDGEGMSAEDVQNNYLVVGRNRRSSNQKTSGRPVMGRKGIGKLAGFGVAEEIEIITWQGDKAVRFYLNISDLKKQDSAIRRRSINVPG